MAQTFTARWGFQCTECGEPVRVGDEATFTGTGDKVHVTCPTRDSDAIGIRPSNLCSKCFLVKPCDCD